MQIHNHSPQPPWTISQFQIHHLFTQRFTCLSVFFLSVFTCLSLAHCSAAAHPLDVSILSVIALFAISSSNVGLTHTVHHFCLLSILILEINISSQYVCSQFYMLCVMCSGFFLGTLVDSVWISVLTIACSLDGIMGELPSWSGAAVTGWLILFFSCLQKHLFSLSSLLFSYFFIHLFLLIFHFPLHLFLLSSLSLHPSLLFPSLHPCLPLSSQVRKGSTGGLVPYGGQHLSGSTEMGRYTVG